MECAGDGLALHGERQAAARRRRRQKATVHQSFKLCGRGSHWHRVLG